MRKKKRTIIFLLLICLCISTGIVYSYLSDRDNRSNTLLIGENEIEPDEPFSPPDEIHPGDIFEKAPALKNTGNVECYVRMLAECSDNRMEEWISLDFNKSEWTEKQPDGYYYYKQPIAPEEKTKPLFTTVRILDTAQQEQLKDFQIIIYGESIQVGTCLNYQEAWEQMESLEGDAV